MQAKSPKWILCFHSYTYEICLPCSNKNDLWKIHISEHDNSPLKIPSASCIQKQIQATYFVSHQACSLPLKIFLPRAHGSLCFKDTGLLSNPKPHQLLPRVSCSCCLELLTQIYSNWLLPIIWISAQIVAPQTDSSWTLKRLPISTDTSLSDMTLSI